jgi:Ca-activated chloride channel family protein
MRKYFFLCGLVLFHLLVTVAGPAFGESARNLVEEGNEAFGRGEYETSLQKYEKARELEPDSAVVLFNRGGALYRQERYDEALNAFEQAASQAMTDGNRELEAKSRYNMGNSAFRRAGQMSRENPRLGLEEFKRSSGFFQDAVKRSPGYTAAAQNLELSRRAAKQLEELIQQQEEQARKQAEQKQEVADELEKLQQEQLQAAQQSGEMAREQEKTGSAGDAGQQAERQESITEQTRETGKKLHELNRQQQGEQLSDEMAGEHVKRALENQEEAEKELQQNNLAAAQQEQEAAALELGKAIQQLQQEQEDSRDKKGTEGQPEESREQAGEQAGQQEPQPGEQETQQEPAAETGKQQEETPGAAAAPGSESAEEIINGELQNRRHRPLGGGTGYRPVEKDW